MDDNGPDPRQPEAVAGVLKTFAILKALAARGDTGLSALSLRLAMPKATLYRFLVTLKELGYVRQHAESERWALATPLFELGVQALDHPDLVELARHPMQALADVTGETVHLGVLIDSEMLYLHKIDSRHALGMYSRVGRRAPLHCTAIGKVLLAWQHPARRDRIVAGMQFTRFREATIADPTALLTELEHVREAGYAEDREEFDEHIRCIAAPIFDQAGQVVASVSVSYPSFRDVAGLRAAWVERLMSAGREVSEGLGCLRVPVVVRAEAGPVPHDLQRLPVTWNGDPA